MATKDKLDTEQVARAYFAAIGKRDLDGMAAVWKPGSTDHMVGMQELSVPEGLREGFGALFAACPDFALEVVDLVVEGEHAAVRWRATSWAVVITSWLGCVVPVMRSTMTNSSVGEG